MGSENKEGRVAGCEGVVDGEEGGGLGHLHLCTEVTMTLLRVTPVASSFSLGSSGALIVKGEITSLLPVLGKALHSQKCLLVTPLLKDILASLDGKLKML